MLDRYTPARKLKRGSGKVSHSRIVAKLLWEVGACGVEEEESVDDVQRRVQVALDWGTRKNMKGLADDVRANGHRRGRQRRQGEDGEDREDRSTSGTTTPKRSVSPNSRLEGGLMTKKDKRDNRALATESHAQVSPGLSGGASGKQPTNRPRVGHSTHPNSEAPPTAARQRVR